MSADMPADTTARVRYDKKLLKVFALVAAVLFLIVFTVATAARMSVEIALQNGLGASVGVAIYVCGIMEFFHVRKASRISRKGIIRLFIGSSLALFLVLTFIVAIVLFYTVPGVDIGTPTDFSSGEVIAVVLGLLVASVLGMAFMGLLAFGAVGVMAALTRLFTPVVLAGVRAISGKRTWREWILAWIFGIPDTLDTRTLTIKALEADTGFPKKTFAQAVGWELVLGGILAIYVAFYPLVVDRSTESVSRLLGVLAPAAMFVPLVIVPWFIYTSLGAKIKGMTKDFTLYEGIKARIFRSYIAVGTLVVFVRISLSETDIDIFLTGFAGYVLGLAVASLLFTFIYFNYFDRELTKDIIEEYNRRIG